MTLPAVELLSHFYEIGTSPHINSTFLWPDGTPVAAERPPAYDPAGQAADPSGAVWVDGGYTGGGSDGTPSKPFTTVTAGLNNIKNGATDKALVVRGAHPAGTGTTAFDGRYRETLTGDLASASGHVTLIAAAHGDGACVVSGLDIIPSNQFTGSGPYTYSGSYNPPVDDCIQIDGVLQHKVGSSPGAGEYTVSGTTLTLGTNPSGKTVEFSNRSGMTLKTTGLEVRGVAFHGFGGTSCISLGGTNQKLTRVVVANASGWGLSTRSTSHYALTEVVLTGCGNVSGKSWDTYKDTFRTGKNIRIWGNNLLQHQSVCPGDTASLAGIKAVRAQNCTDDGVLCGYNFSNGWWLDIQCVNNTMTNFVLWRNGGYGFTIEVGYGHQLANGFVAYNGSLHNIPNYCGAGKRAGNQDGYRISGYNSVTIMHVTSTANYGTNYTADEDGRAYPHNTHVGLGDTWNHVRRNNVYVRTVEHDTGGNLIGQSPNFKSFDGAVRPLNCCPSDSNGFPGTVCISHAEMHSSAAPGATPVNAGTDHNLYFDATGNKNQQVAHPSGGWVWDPGGGCGSSNCKLTGCGGTTTLANIAAAQALMASGQGFEAGSQDVQHSAGSYHTAGLFPHAGDTVPEWSWWGLAKIPAENTTVLTASQTVPAWVRTALGVSSTDTLYLGCGPGLPYPRPIGATPGNSAPTLSNIAPADGTTVTAGATVTVTVDADDDSDTPGSGLTATGQAYAPPVTISSITVSGTTATVVTAANHNMSTGAKARISGNTPAALNAAAATVTVVNSTTFTYTVPSGTGNATVKGTSELLGSAITMTANGSATGFTGTWLAPSTNGIVRRLEVVATDSGGLSSAPLAAVVTTTTTPTDNPPVVALLTPAPSSQITAAAGQPIAVLAVDPDGDAVTATAFTVKDASSTTVASGTLTAAVPVATTIAAGSNGVDVTSLDGTATVHLASNTGLSATGGTLGVVIGTGASTKIAVLAYTGTASTTDITGVQLLSATTGTLATGQTVKTANYTASYDATGFAGTYTVQATVTANSAVGASPAVTVSTNTAPSASWVYPSPSPKQTVSGTVTLHVSASDDSGFAHLKAGLYNLDTGSPVFVGAFTRTATDFTYSFDTTTLTDQADHRWRARVVDSGGLFKTADVTFHVDQGADTTGPTISGVQPADSTTVAGTFPVGAQITDPSGVASAGYSIDSGDLTGDLTAGPFGWVAAVDSTDPQDGLDNGTHTLVITATDTNGNTSSTSPVTFTVANIAASDFRPTHNAVGFVVPAPPAAIAAGDRAALWASLAATGCTTVRTVADWSVLQPTNAGNASAGMNDQLDATALGALDAFLDDAQAHGIRVILTVYRTPTWAHPTTTSLPAGVTWGALTQVAPEREPENGYPDLANFAALLAGRYGTDGTHDTAGTLLALEVWDEPNNEHWMQPAGTGTRAGVNYGPDAGMYAQAVIGIYNAVHSGLVTHRDPRTAHPEILIVAGATGVAKAGGGPSAQNYAPGTFYLVWLAVPGAAAAFDHVSHHPQFDGVLYAGFDPS